VKPPIAAHRLRARRSVRPLRRVRAGLASEEIVVTARGREEALRDAPDAIAVVPVRARDVQRLEDVQEASPGVFVMNDQTPGPTS
jgi:outer membrane receptor protein involved in Fe transport